MYLLLSFESGSGGGMVHYSPLSRSLKSQKSGKNRCSSSGLARKIFYGSDEYRDKTAEFASRFEEMRGKVYAAGDAGEAVRGINRIIGDKAKGKTCCAPI